MSRAHLFSLLALALTPQLAPDTQPAPEPDAQRAPDAQPAPETRQTPFPEAFRAFRELVEQGDVEGARALTEPLLAGATLDEPRRAALHFGLGLVRAQGDDEALWPEAAGEFQTARALAGAGELRLDATYDAGVVELQTAERLRARIPEVAQALGSAATPGLQQVPPPAPPGPIVPPGGPQPGAPGATPEQEDPLPLARAAYERARGTLCERLRADWQDVDTRANLELVQRRLRELDEIERRREEQQEQQEQQQEPSDDPSQDEEGDPKDQEKSEQDPSQQDPSQEDQSSQQEEQRDPQEQQEQQEEPSEEQQGDPNEDPTAEQPSPENPQELEPPEGAEQGEAQPQAQDSERHLTREEVMRLLDRLAEMEQQGKEFEARLRQARRQAVERDW
jgi:hypothetical protein